MKDIYFTNNDLAKAMGLEVGKTYQDKKEVEWKCVVYNGEREASIVAKNGDICFYNEDYDYSYLVRDFVGVKLTEVSPKPQLTEQEITILKGRLAEGYTHIKREYSSVGRGYITFSYLKEDKYEAYSSGLTNMKFEFIKRGEEHSIEELLKGVGE